METLSERHAELPQPPQLGRALDALCDEQASHLGGVSDERAHERGAVFVVVDVAHERAVELQVAGAYRDDLAQPGVAGAHVVHRQQGSLLSQWLECARKLQLAPHERLLGDLDDQSLQCVRVARAGLQQHVKRQRIEQHRRRQVDRQACPPRTVFEQLERLAQAGALQRVSFSELLGQREPRQWAAVGATVRESGERLVCVHRPGAYLRDRLHRHGQPLAFYELAGQGARADQLGAA